MSTNMKTPRHVRNGAGAATKPTDQMYGIFDESIQKCKTAALHQGGDVSPFSQKLFNFSGNTGISTSYRGGYAHPGMSHYHHLIQSSQPRNVQDRFKVSLRIVSPSSTTNMLFKLVLAESIHLVLNTSDLTKALPQPQETTVSSVVQPPANQDQETKRRRTSRSSLTTSMEEVSRLKVQGHQPKSRLPLKSIQTTSRNIKTFKTSNTCNINNIWKTVRINRCISELVQCMEKVPTIRRHLL